MYVITLIETHFATKKVHCSSSEKIHIIESKFVNILVKNFT